ncbi:VWA domain-containing protein [Flavobacteriaceae bacterium S0825]|uniref:VWA domain-containing protein n=1 Tax=Gaetbulibacter sp. S0825 TaxID=2720084 RepID=UPI00142F9BAC|nr:VWA domain-containing protein [Gaetbulibacter sp. S0825]MCK0109723.1 VWA domain-containing protein [Flavobacteriaceae bacterium S0825]NIX65355.1 VWA domain-containing protein [Gaetbulibacter sp. S0825]
MSGNTLLYIILAGITALLLALFQYIYKSKKRKLNPIFSFLRFITIFSVLLLIINPKFEKVALYNEKPNLVVVVDDSESVKHLEQDKNVNELLASIKNSKELNDKFNLDIYSFGSDFQKLDSLNFNQSQTNYTSVFSNLQQIYKESNSPTVLISDGNQTFGRDFEFSSKQYKQPIFSVILGDTITYSDLKIQQLNVNKYAYLKNKFPVEVIAVYNGNTPVNSTFTIKNGNTTLYSTSLQFSKTNNSQTLNITLPSDKVGVNSYVASLSPLSTEKNIVNNSKPFALEVIDQKTNVAIVTSISHPDIGTLKKAIESNEQRTAFIVSPMDYISNKEDYQMVILYQPNSSFKTVFESLDVEGKNRFIITGINTDWAFLNSIQNVFQQKITNQEESFQAIFNDNFNTFLPGELAFDNLPPLESEFGDVEFNIPIEALLFKSINNNIIEETLMATYENVGQRGVMLFGEGIWRWRSQSYLDTNSFNQFDDFIGKIMQYTASNKRRNRLNINYEPFYNGSDNIKITAQFFNKNYEFDAAASLEMVIKNIETNKTTVIPFVLQQNTYEVNLNDFPSGDYDFTVRANRGEVTSSGRTKILDYNVEKQFLNANVSKLERLANSSNGSSYLIDDTTSIIDDLINDSRFVTVQKSNKNVVPLIDFKYLLGLIILSLSIEWFLRKYNGLI